MEEIIRFANRANKLFESVTKKMKDVEVSLGSIVNDETKDYVFFRLRGKIENWLKDIEEAINDISKEHGKFILETKGTFGMDQASYYEATKMLEIVTTGISKVNKMLEDSYKMFMNATYSQQHKFVISKIEESFKLKFNVINEISSNMVDLSSRINLLQEQMEEIIKRSFKTEGDMDEFLEYAAQNFISRDFIQKVDDKIKLIIKDIGDINSKLKLPQFKSY